MATDIPSRPNKTGPFSAAWEPGEWAIANQMLCDVKQLLDREKINYFICYGTLLGAVRHRGIIPWDDDIDFGILEEDQTKFLSLEVKLEKLGYSICEWSIPWGDSTLEYYKIWIKSRVADNALPYSWPFIDVFVFRPGSRPNEYFDGQHKIDATDLFPLRNYRFGLLDLAGPNTLQFLIDEYGEDYATRCISNPHDHKLEKPQPTASARFDELESHGYCIDVHHVDPYSLQRCPQHAHQVAMRVRDDKHELISTDGTRYKVNQTLAQIWERCDGSQNIGQIISGLRDHFQLPRIDLSIDVINAIDILFTHKLIRFK